MDQLLFGGDRNFEAVGVLGTHDAFQTYRLLRLHNQCDSGLFARPQLAEGQNIRRDLDVGFDTTLNSQSDVRVGTVVRDENKTFLNVADFGNKMATSF